MLHTPVYASLSLIITNPIAAVTSTPQLMFAHLFPPVMYPDLLSFHPTSHPSRHLSSDHYPISLITHTHLSSHANAIFYLLFICTASLLTRISLHRITCIKSPLIENYLFPMSTWPFSQHPFFPLTMSFPLSPPTADHPGAR